MREIKPLVGSCAILKEIKPPSPICYNTLDTTKSILTIYAMKETQDQQDQRRQRLIKEIEGIKAKIPRLQHTLSIKEAALKNHQSK